MLHGVGIYAIRYSVKICFLFHVYKFRMAGMCDEKEMDWHAWKQKNVFNPLFPL
jgi:hypothetical protein